MNNQPDFFQTHPTLGIFVLGYVVLAGLVCFPLIRRPIVHWYKSQTWFIHGSGVIDIMLKQIGMRLTVEMLAFGIACVVGPLGLWLYVVRRKQHETPQIIDN